MRAFLCSLTALMLAMAAYIVFTTAAINSRPLDPGLAYEALVAKLQKTAAGRHLIDLSQATLMQRQKEIIFFGQGRVHLADQSNYGLPLIESYDFQYIGVVGRTCAEWHSDCYRARELEITGKKTAGPMI